MLVRGGLARLLARDRVVSRCSSSPPSKRIGKRACSFERARLTRFWAQAEVRTDWV